MILLEICYSAIATEPIAKKVSSDINGSLEPMLIEIYVVISQHWCK